jgi:hypothetical protein
LDLLSTPSSANPIEGEERRSNNGTDHGCASPRWLPNDTKFITGYAMELVEKDINLVTLVILEASG